MVSRAGHIQAGPLDLHEAEDVAGRGRGGLDDLRRALAQAAREDGYLRAGTRALSGAEGGRERSREREGSGNREREGGRETGGGGASERERVDSSRDVQALSPLV
jgi:hypothetical protein